MKFCSRLFGAIGSISRVLSSTAIYLDPGLLLGSSHLLGTAGPACCPTHGVAPDRVYSTPMFPWGGCALTAPFHPYLPGGRRYLSVALVLGSPPAGVTRYPCPAEPGLSSRGAFRPPPAAVRPGRGPIVADFSGIVKTFSPPAGNPGFPFKSGLQTPGKRAILG